MTTVDVRDIPTSLEDARNELSDAEQLLESLNAELSLAMAKRIDAVATHDAKGGRSAGETASKALSAIERAEARVAFLKPVVQRFEDVQQVVERSERERRFEALKPDMKRIEKDLQRERKAVISMARKFVLDVKAFSDVVADTRDVRNEFAVLETEFKPDEPRTKMPELQIRDFQLAPGLPLHEALKDITGAKQHEFRNRSRRPLKLINRHANMIEKRKKGKK